jgi:hypothetical protein
LRLIRLICRFIWAQGLRTNKLAITLTSMAMRKRQIS